MPTYQVEGIQSIEKLRAAASEFWESDDLRREALLKGVEVGSLPRTLEGAVTIERQGSGFDPVSTALIVSFAPVAAKVTSDFWTHFVLPRLRRRFGEDSIRDAE